MEKVRIAVRKFGPFEYAIGHSLGSMSILNAIKNGLQIRKLVIIGSGDSVNDILKDLLFLSLIL